MSRIVLNVIGCCLTLAAVEARADDLPPYGTGTLLEISVEPESITLDGKDDRQQLIITGHYENGGLRDLTSAAALRVTDEKIARLVERTSIVPVGDGAATLSIDVDGIKATSQVTVTRAEHGLPINFANEIVPILTKLGCNAGSCHGKSAGQNGFKLSLLGFDAQHDYDALVHEARGRRVLEATPDKSLLLLKTSGGLPHGGGELLDRESADYRLLLRWIASGLPFGSDGDPTIKAIQVVPAQRVLNTKSPQQLRVVAIYNDDSTADVTQRAEYDSNDPELLNVTEAGSVRTFERYGEGSVMIRYQGLVTIFRAAIPQDVPAESLEFPQPTNFVDEHVFRKLKRLGLPPSELCTDSEFLRRVSLDITGTLPTVEEAHSFLDSTDADKRGKLVDSLLEKPEYATYFALRWGDVLRLKGGRAGKKGVDGDHERGLAFHDWIKESLSANKPYDQFVREILTVNGPTSGPETEAPMSWWLQLKMPSQLVDDTAQAFLGTRVQCAQCHHHPFERWSQDDYWGLAAFFGRVQWQNENKGKFTPVKDAEAGRLGQHLGRDPNKQLSSLQGKVYATPFGLGAEPVSIAEDVDPRAILADWMAAKDNPFFAPALVNRYWGHFLGRGIVEPVDDMRVTNPPSNPALLDALARDFIEHKFDLKHLVRTICKSRTYQAAVRPNAFNKTDTRQFSRRLPKRLPAEVLHDAVDQVCGTTSAFRFPEAKEETPMRAIEIPYSSIRSYFLEVFGRAERNTACECERTDATTLAQKAHLLNGRVVAVKLAERAKQLGADQRSAEEKLEELYLAAFTRKPNLREVAAIESYLTKKTEAAGSGQDAATVAAWQDVVWALVNSKEFQFNH